MAPERDQVLMAGGSPVPVAPGLGGDRLEVEARLGGQALELLVCGHSGAPHLGVAEEQEAQGARFEHATEGCEERAHLCVPARLGVPGA